MGRLSLSLRLVLIVAGAMMLLQLVAVAVQVTRDDGFATGSIQPAYAREIVALARLFDRMPPFRRALALELLSQSRYRIENLDAPVLQAQQGYFLGLTANAIEQRLAESGLGERVTVAYVPREEADDRAGPLVRLLGRQLQISVSLSDGSWLVIRPASEVTSYVFGSLLSVGAGLFGLLVVMLAVSAVLRETRPLAALSADAERFARTAEPRELPERGAPELRTLIAATNRMQRQIAALLRNRTVILAGLSHDLRTQITRLRLRLELLDPSEARSRAIADIEAVEALIAESLDFAALDAPSPAARTDVAALLRRMAGEHEGDDRFSLTASATAAAPIHAAIGEAALHRVLHNLVHNAIAYGGRADLSLAVEAEHIAIAVADRGPGVPEPERQRIFEPFYRLEHSRSRAHGGTGLGLAIVQQIVERHGGSIAIADRPGGGAVFTLTLPRAG